MKNKQMEGRWLKPAGAALLAGLATVGFATGAAAQDKIEVRLGLTTPDDSILGVNGRMWNKLTEMYSNGRVSVKNFPSSQLGKERAQLEGLVTGSHDVFLHISAYTGKFPETRYWDLPFLFPDTDRVTRVFLDDNHYADMEKVFEKESMVWLGHWGYGYRAFSIRNKPYNTPEDLRGQKHRIPGGKSKFLLFESLGANVSTVSFAELYQALSAGVVDSQDNPIQMIYSSKFHEPTNYLSLLNIYYNPNILAAGKPFWDKLDKETQDVLKKSAKVMQAWSIKQADLYDQEFLQKILEAKPTMKVNTLDPATLPAWKEKSKPVYEAFVEEAGKPWADNIFQFVEGGYYKKQIN